MSAAELPRTDQSVFDALAALSHAAKALEREVAELEKRTQSLQSQLEAAKIELANLRRQVNEEQVEGALQVLTSIEGDKHLP